MAGFGLGHKQNSSLTEMYLRWWPPFFTSPSYLTQRSSLSGASSTVITSFSARWFSSAGAPLLCSAGCFARGNWHVYTSFITRELHGTEELCGPSSAAVGLCSGRIRGLVLCEETAAASRTPSSKETIRNTLFLLLPTINLHCSELDTVYGISGF